MWSATAFTDTIARSYSATVDGLWQSHALPSHAVTMQQLMGYGNHMRYHLTQLQCNSWWVMTITCATTAHSYYATADGIWQSHALPSHTVTMQQLMGYGNHMRYHRTQLQCNSWWVMAITCTTIGLSYNATVDGLWQSLELPSHLVTMQQLMGFGNHLSYHRTQLQCNSWWVMAITCATIANSYNATVDGLWQSHALPSHAITIQHLMGYDIHLRHHSTQLLYVTVDGLWEHTPFTCATMRYHRTQLQYNIWWVMAFTYATIVRSYYM